MLRFGYIKGKDQNKKFPKRWTEQRIKELARNIRIIFSQHTVKAKVKAATTKTKDLLTEPIIEPIIYDLADEDYDEKDFSWKKCAKIPNEIEQAPEWVKKIVQYQLYKASKELPTSSFIKHINIYHYFLPQESKGYLDTEPDENKECFRGYRSKDQELGEMIEKINISKCLISKNKYDRTFPKNFFQKTYDTMIAADKLRRQAPTEHQSDRHEEPNYDFDDFELEQLLNAPPSPSSRQYVRSRSSSKEPNYDFDDFEVTEQPIGGRDDEHSPHRISAPPSPSRHIQSRKRGHDRVIPEEEHHHLFPVATEPNGDAVMKDVTEQQHRRLPPSSTLPQIKVSIIGLKKGTTQTNAIWILHYQEYRDSGCYIKICEKSHDDVVQQHPVELNDYLMQHV